jgi:predicted nucleic acid-binding protein
VKAAYWDSVCFLGWLQDEIDKVDSCRAVLEEADAGRYLIVTSALTIAEVLAVRGRPRLPTVDKSKVEAFFQRSYIDVRSVTRRTAESARDLVWTGGVAPKDAIHIATALGAGMSELHTFDVDMLKQSGLIGDGSLTITKPYLVQGRLV